MPQADELMIARLAGYCTGVLRVEGHLTTQQAMDGMVQSVLSSPQAGVGATLLLDREATSCLKKAAITAEKTAVAYNKRAMARQRREDALARQEAAEARMEARRVEAEARGLRYSPSERKYVPAFKVMCQVCGTSTATGKQGKPPKVHPGCKK